MASETRLFERKPSRIVVLLVIGLLCLIWGSTWLVIQEGLRDLPPLTSAGVRFGLAETELYSGNGVSALRKVNDGWEELEKSSVLRIQSGRILMLHLRARCACASMGSCLTSACA